MTKYLNVPIEQVEIDGKRYYQFEQRFLWGPISGQKYIVKKTLKECKAALKKNREKYLHD